MKQEEIKIKMFNQAIEMLATESLDNFSINKLIQTLSISKGSFFHHFHSKDTFFQELVKYLSQLHQDKLKVEEQNHNTFTQAYLNFCLNEFGSKEMIAYNNLSQFEDISIWDSFYQEIKDKLIKEHSEAKALLIIMTVDGVWLNYKHINKDQLKSILSLIEEVK